ncbi:class I adenylate-forming enzyme family protein [Mycobacterium spongiae]|uniref:AMP-binding protein n=1 Tax=Mycobacterium spongiae TaxID=886343 RepID=A0A975K3M2_9MYCO|nr:class I adenylate-forming enzyme family protein [Mycobacterium spongiae]QUR69248.1 AMP-binding protein [Mycobacterium spongiae]
MTGQTGTRRGDEGIELLFQRAHHYHRRAFDESLVDPLDVVERLGQWSVRRPDAPCLTTITPDGTVHTLSFAQVYAQSARMASWLASEHDVGPGVVVAVLPRNDTRSVLCILGVLRAGAIAFMVDPEERPERLKALLSAFPIAGVHGADPTPAASTLGALDVPDACDLPDNPPPTIESAYRGPALYFGTSGSTAASKVVAQSRYAAAINAEAVTRHHGLGPGVRILGCLPIHHVNGLNFSIFATLWSGSETVLVQGPRPDLLHHSITTTQPDLVSIVPTALDLLVLSDLDIRSPRLRYFVSAAAPLTARTAQAVWERFAIPVIQGYGLTEAVNFSTTMPTDLSSDMYRHAVLEVPVPAIGAALFGNEVAVLRPDGTKTDLDEQGEICVRGHNVMLEYVDNPDATLAAFEHGWLHTGDLGVSTLMPGLDAPVHVVTGRSKNVAVVMGVTISLEELESRIRDVPGVEDAACVAVADQLRGETIVAAVVVSSTIKPATYSQHLATHFSPLVLPSRWLTVPAIPRTATGKIIRHALPRLVGDA